MAVLSDLAKSQQTTQVGGASLAPAGQASVGNIKATKQIDNSAKLAGDLGKMFGDTVKEVQSASEYAGKRVGLDNLVEYKVEMTKLDDMYDNASQQTSASMAQKAVFQEALYKKYASKGTFANNDIANQGFKDNYMSPAYDILNKGLKDSNKQRVGLFKDETVLAVTKDIQFLGSDISSDMLNTYKERYKLAGLDPEGVTTLYLSAASTSLEKEINTNDKAYYNSAGTVDEASVNELVDNTYKLVMDTNNEKLSSDISSTRELAMKLIKSKANEKHTEYMSLATSKAKSMLYKDKPFTDKNGTRHYYAGSSEEFEREIKASFPLLNDVDYAKIIGIYKEDNSGDSGSNSYMVTDFVTRYNREITELYTNNKDVKPEAVKKFVDESTWMLASNAFSPADKVRINKALTDATIIMENNDKISKEIEDIISGSMSIADGKSHVDEGTLRTAQDGNTYVVKDRQYDNMYKNEISKTETSLRNMDVKSQEGKASFIQTLYKADVLQETLDGGTPKIFDFYDKVVKDKTNISTMSGDEIRQFVQYGDYQLTANVKEFAGYQRNLAVLDSYIRQIDADEDMPEAEKENSIKSFARSTLDWQMTPKNAITMWNKALDDVKTGNNYMFTAFNSRGATNLNNVLQSLYLGEYEEDDIESFIGSYEFYDLGSGNITRDNQRILQPKSMTKTKIDFLMEEYLKPEGLDEGDVMLEAFRSHGQSGSVNIGYRVMYKSVNGQVKSLGDITIDAYNKKKKG